MPVISSSRVAASANISNYANTIVGTIGKNEIDNHADTICAGPNWKLLELSGEFCSVTPFSADYHPKTNVPVAKCATAYTCPESGQSVLLVADQVLWFGADLHCSLLNPHQIDRLGIVYATTSGIQIVRWAWMSETFSFRFWHPVRTCFSKLASPATGKCPTCQSLN